MKGHEMMNWDASGGGWTHGAWGFMMLFWAITVGLAVWGLTRLFPRGAAGTNATEPLEVRLARGDISSDDYRTIRAELAKDRNGAADQKQGSDLLAASPAIIDPAARTATLTAASHEPPMSRVSDHESGCEGERHDKPETRARR